jgi:hypothetical protein
MKNNHYVYALLRENSVPFYIGMGHGYRWSEHEKRCESERSHKANIIRQFRRAGLRVPRVKLEERLSRDEAVRLEMRLIAILGREPNGPLTNLTPGGEGRNGCSPSDETRAKMRAAKLGTRRVFSVEHRRKLSRAARRRMIREPGQFESAARKSMGGSRPESRQKNRLAHLGRKRSLAAIKKFRATMRLRSEARCQQR